MASAARVAYPAALQRCKLDAPLLAAGLLTSRDSVYSGHYDEIANTCFQNEKRYTTKIDETFLKQINKWRMEIGSYLYNNKDEYKDIAVINDTVQDFINQIIFLRICEDRKLPLYMKLYETVNNREELQEALTAVFKEADRRYNSGLFRGTNPIFDLKCDIIFEMIESLYYPKTPYMFVIIEPSILGKIYEAFLAESLVIKDGKICLDKKKEYIYKSVVSTPVEIVKYMVKSTLEPLCDKKSPKEVLNIRIADIACGSGVFLEEAYQFLVDYCVGWYSINDKEHLIELSNGKYKLPLAEKKSILCSCVYGIDIDIHAVEVSRFSLLLKLIEDETMPSVKEEEPILPDLDSNVKHGNSLVSSEDLENVAIETEELLKIVPFDWHMLNDGQRFDVIIGNPPYVKTEDIKKLHSSYEVDVYRRFTSAHRQYDKYYLFIEKAMKLIHEKGVVCYIVPNKFLHTESAEKLRVMIKDKIVKLDDFGAAQLFEDKTIYSSIISLNGENADNLVFRNVDNVTQLWSDLPKEVVHINKVNLNAMPWCKKIEDSSGKLPWFICGDKDYSDMLANAASKIVPLSEIVEIYNGIQTSAEKIYKIEGKTILSDDDLYVKFESLGKEYLIEKGIVKPYFKPTRREQGSIDPYSSIEQLQINYNIFPYDQNGEFITKDIMEKDYPYAWKYLLEHKNKLMPKSLGGHRDVQPEVSNPDEWYRYGRSQAITSLNNRQKIIVGVNRSKGDPLYLLDNNNYLIASGGTAGYVGISLLPRSKYRLEYIHAWLSNPWTDLYLQLIGSDFEGGFIARGTYTLPMVPFVEIDFSDERQCTLYDEVITTTRKVFDINKEMLRHIDKATESVLQKEKERLIRKIKDFITKVYQQKF